jgi:uridine kinase
MWMPDVKHVPHVSLNANFRAALVGSPIVNDPLGETALVARFADLAAMIRDAPARCGHIRLVAVDGPGGAGKSVLADRLAHHLDGAPVVHTDDFASWDEPIHWWKRLETQVLGPLERGEPVRYQAYDWAMRRLGDWRVLPATDVVVLEGVSSARLAVADRLSLAIWVETPRAKRLARGIDRDGEAMRPQWDAWMAEEDAHYAVDRTTVRADVIIDGAPTMPHDPATEVVRLRRDAHP